MGELALKKKKVSAPTTVYAAGDAALRIGNPVYRGSDWIIAGSYILLDYSDASICVGISMDTSTYQSVKITGYFKNGSSKYSYVAAGIAASVAASDIQSAQWNAVRNETSNVVSFQTINQEQSITVDISGHSGNNVVVIECYQSFVVTGIEVQ